MRPYTPLWSLSPFVSVYRRHIVDSSPLSHTHIHFLRILLHHIYYLPLPDPTPCVFRTAYHLTFRPEKELFTALRTGNEESAKERIEGDGAASYDLSHHAYVYAALLSRKTYIMELLVANKCNACDTLFQPPTLRNVSNCDVPALVHAMRCLTHPDVLEVAFDAADKIDWSEMPTRVCLTTAIKMTTYQEEYIRLMLRYGLKVSGTDVSGVLGIGSSFWLNNDGALLADLFRSIVEPGGVEKTLQRTIMAAYTLCRGMKATFGHTSDNHMDLTKSVLHNMSDILPDDRHNFIGEWIMPYLPAEMFCNRAGVHDAKLTSIVISEVAAEARNTANTFAAQLISLACEQGYLFDNKTGGDQTMIAVLSTICSQQDEELLSKVLGNIGQNAAPPSVSSAFRSFLWECWDAPLFLIRNLLKFTSSSDPNFHSLVQEILCVKAAQKGAST